MRTIIESYREMGFTTSLDDFGNGYANLDLLTDLCPDSLKIDRELVMGCDSDKRRQAILRSLVALAKILGTQLIGEGVETREESRCLLNLGIPIQQGYYFSYPNLEALADIDDAKYD
jgi:EAL domain-containing protein (putative c-di-GMP-specific phosphodiesterase class I)